MKRGFTLVEVVITISILLLIMGGSMSALGAFKERRGAQADALKVAEKLRSAQVRASAVEVPSGCTGVRSYTVNMSGANLTVLVSCTSGGPITLTEMATRLENSVFTPVSSVVFNSPTGTANQTTIGVCSSPTLYEVTVSGSGNVSLPVLNASGC